MKVTQEKPTLEKVIIEIENSGELETIYWSLREYIEKSGNDMKATYWIDETVAREIIEDLDKVRQ